MTSYQTVQIVVSAPASWTTDYVLMGSAYTVINSQLSLMPMMMMGELSMTGNATATVITTASTPTKVNPAGFSTFTGSSHWTSKQAGRLTYVGPITHQMHCGCTISVKGAGANDVFKALLYLSGGVNGNNEFTSGTALTAGTTVQKMGPAGDVTSTAIHVFASMTSGDYLELSVQNTTDTDDVTLSDVNLFAVGIL